MKASGGSLVDANVWLALAVDAHFHHATAMAWFDGQDVESCAFVGSLNWRCCAT